LHPMLAKLHCGTITLLLLTALLCGTTAEAAGNLSADEYLALRSSLGAKSAALSAIKANLRDYIGKTIEVTGTVNGIASCEESATFLLNCGGECLVVKAADIPKCMETGNTVRALIGIGPNSIASLSDLKLEGAAYEYDVVQREKQLAPKPKKAAPAPARSASNSKAFLKSRRARGVSLSSRAMQIYDPYKRAIARFNPRLTAQQLDTITKSVLAFSERYGVDPRLVVALILVESGFKPTATSPKGAMGLGQLMPGTARGLGVGNAYDPVQNVEASIRLIRGHLDKYGNLALALSAYNAGGGAVRKYGGIPPYRETVNYVRKVSQIYKALCGK